MNSKRRRQVASIAKRLSGLKAELQLILQAEQDALENMPKNLLLHGRNGIENVISDLEDADNSVQEALDYLDSVICEEMEYQNEGNGEPLLKEVAEYIVKNNDASISHIKRDFHIGHERAQNILWKLVSAEVLEGAVGASTRNVEILVHDTDVLMDKLEDYDRCLKLYDAFKLKYPNVKVLIGAHLHVGVVTCFGMIKLQIILDTKKKWWICEATRLPSGQMSPGADYVDPLNLSPEVIEEFKGIFETIDDERMRSNFFASFDDPIECFVKAYNKFEQLEKENKL